MQDHAAYARAATGRLRAALRLNRLFNAALALFLIVLTSPLLLLLYLLVWLTQGRPVLYRGIRLGLHKRHFFMYKFRTLVPDAERILGPQLLTQGHQLVTPLGKYLRESRLDELPQLFNVLRGDMDFVGPRPERPAIYEKICRFIPDYDRRFEIKPGLVGISQLCTPHGTPKRMRALIDNRLLNKKGQLMWDACFVFMTGVVVLRNSLRKLVWAALHDWVAGRLLHRYQEKRAQGRVPQVGSNVSWLPAFAAGEPQGRARLCNINEEAFLMRSEERIEAPLPARFLLEREIVRRHARLRRKVAECEGELYREHPAPDGGFEYVVKYRPASPFQFYLVHQYFLHESVLDHR